MYINLSITFEKYVGHMGTYQFIIGYFEILLSLRSIISVYGAAQCYQMNSDISTNSRKYKNVDIASFVLGLDIRN